MAMSGEDGTTSRSSSSAFGDSEKAIMDGECMVASRKAEAADIESFIGDWDGPNDPQNPMDWSGFRQWLTIGLVTFSGFNTALVSTVFAPGLPQVLQEFNSTDPATGSLTISIYVMGAALGPLFLTTLTEISGRLPITHVGNILFVISAAICGASTNMPMLIIARFFMGTASAVPVTVGGGFIADFWPMEKRGSATTIWTAGPLLGFVVGPIFGGYMGQEIRWRWTVWLEAILGSFIAIVSLLCLRETYTPLLLLRRAARAQKTSGPVLVVRPDKERRVGRLLWSSVCRPLKLPFRSPVVLLISVSCSVAYSYMYILFTTFPSIFKDIYNFDAGQVGLAYLGLGAGFCVSQCSVGYFSDRHLKKRLAWYGRVIPEDRLPPMKYGFVFIAAGLLWYGISVEYRAHWIVPIIGTFSVGMGVYYVKLVGQVYLLDAFTRYAASAVSAEVFLRSVFGAVLPLAGPELYRKLGMAWGNGLLAIFAAAFFASSLVLGIKGEALRTNPRFQPNLG